MNSTNKNEPIKHTFNKGVVMRCLSNIREFELLNIGFNSWNGFYFTLIGIELFGDKKGFIGSLLGIHISFDVILLHVFFVEIEFKSPFIK